MEEVKVMSAKEIKKKFRKEFQNNYQKYYPVKFFESIDFKRNQCTNCSNYFWNIDQNRTLCGDSNCVGSYTFIGQKNYLGKEKGTFSIAQAWQTFEDSFTTARIPSTRIKRYPVVARWRNDVDYVQAGIYCFQPYCVTGEMQPPANPLICPQFCVRFNDLDNIGLTGRHYSGFVMIGIQVFNYPNEYHFFKEECVEFNYRWLTEGLKIPPQDICFSEDIWAGGGNMGPCVEYFVNGMEIGNMVFMQYKTFHDGSLEELKTKVIDTGIGLERVAWLLNGDSTSYISTFRQTYKFLCQKLKIEFNKEVWDKLGPYSTRLDVDECENLEKTWEQISELLKMDKSTIVQAIEPLRELFIVLDHTRSIMFLIRDGSLPSNVGGGFNLRNILRRTFAILEKNGWWEQLGFDGFMELFKYQEKDIEDLYGKFDEYSSFRDIIELEYQRYKNTDQQQQQQLKKLLKKNKGKMTLQDWYVAVTSWGIAPDTISKISKLSVPDNLYYYIDEQRNRVGKAPEQVLYDTSNQDETVCLYYDHIKHLNDSGSEYKFKGKIIAIFNNILQENKPNMVILDRSAFYPTSGGQQNDTGTLTIDNKEYQVVNVEKVGKCIIHTLDKELDNSYIGKEVLGQVDENRRKQLRNHHTSAHIIFAASRKVLGPHVWQQGAKKTLKQAHLDITHYSSLSKDQELLIEETANRIIMDSISINKTLQKKDDAELKHGFSLYQGGVVPGNELRVVNIEGVDVEACCGTHCDNTSQVGWIKVLNSKRIADGIVRLYFVAGERTLNEIQSESRILNQLTDLWQIPKDQLSSTADRFFRDYKKYKGLYQDSKKKQLELQIKLLLSGDKDLLVQSEESNPTLYFSTLPRYYKDLQKNKRNVVFCSDTFVFGFLSTLDIEPFKKYFGQKLKVQKKKQGVQFTFIGKYEQNEEIFKNFEKL